MMTNRRPPVCSAFTLALATGAICLGAAAGVAHAADLSVGFQQEPTSLDPTADATASIDGMLTQNVYESLTLVAENGEVGPNLAESWDVSEDGLIYTFHLVGDTTFHDGSAFDASDVVYSFDRAMAEDSVNPSKDIFEPIESVEAIAPARSRSRSRTRTRSSSSTWARATARSSARRRRRRTTPIPSAPARSGSTAGRAATG